MDMLRVLAPSLGWLLLPFLAAAVAFLIGAIRKRQGRRD